MDDKKLFEMMLEKYMQYLEIMDTIKMAEKDYLKRRSKSKSRGRE